MVHVPLRRIRSFVKRPGRVTAAQRRALDTLWPQWGIPFREHKRLDLDAAFGRKAPRVLDIGFGDGEALLTSAANNPGIDYFGVEVHEPGIGHLLVLLERAGLTNVRLIDRDVVDVIAHMIDSNCFDAVNVFFPDPWPKKRHHKRRLIQAEFVGVLASILKPDGLLHITTDWANYAEHIRAELAENRHFSSIAPEVLADDPLAFRPPTKFERRGRRLGHEVVDFVYRRTGAAN
jgi:tRNA (guanine-N7-)-methyltransferase